MNINFATLGFCADHSALRLSYSLIAAAGTKPGIWFPMGWPDSVGVIESESRQNDVVNFTGTVNTPRLRTEHRTGGTDCRQSDAPNEAGPVAAEGVA